VSPVTRPTGAPPRLGLCFPPTFPPERLVGLARAADAAGVAELWVWEDCFKESGIASAAAALATTERVQVGIGLLPVPLRNVALTAMEIATLARLFPGRLLPGIGHGVLDWMGQVGARVESPLTLLREYAGALRALLAGGPVTVHGRYVSLDGVTLDWPPSPPPPLYGGSVGPKSLAVIGELLDGAILDWSSPEQLRSARAIIDPLAAAAGRGRMPLVTTLIAASGPGAPDRVAAEQARWDLEPGAGGAVAGEAEAIAAAVRTLGAAGATSVVLQPTADEPDAEAFVAGPVGAVATLLAE
jgi:alkanesulfonate monooxygenase SsuD/methylene tetrahydromethanopterin reductase-like flavin-dependent oxidoreductase (luciferase family)